MQLNKILLDRIYRRTLENVAIEEGMISRLEDSESIDFSPYSSDYEPFRLTYKSRVLQLLTIFETIDSDASMYDLSAFIDEGVISPNANIVTPIPLELHSLSKANKTLHELCNVLSIKILQLFKRNIVSFHLSINPFYEYLRKKYLAEFNIITNDLVLAAKMGRMPVDFLDDMEVTIDNLRDNLILSCINNWTIGSALTINKYISNREVKIIEDLYYLVRTKLDNEVNILPMPQSIAETFLIRNKPEMKAFRRVFAYWCDALRTGDEYAENVIRKDLKSANWYLQKLSKWKRYRRTPINFVMHAIGGQIPGLSNIISAIDTLTEIGTKFVEKRYNWIMLLR